MRDYNTKFFRTEEHEFLVWPRVFWVPIKYLKQIYNKYVTNILEYQPYKDNNRSFLRENVNPTYTLAQGSGIFHS